MKLEVIRWEKGSCQTIWRGKDKDQALVVAGFAFGKEIVEAQCLEQKKLNPWEQILDMAYAKKIKVRFTISEEQDPRKEAEGNKPKIIASFGDQTIKTFQRLHFD